VRYDHEPELPAEGEEMKPYYEQDGITIYHGDCREVLPTLAKVDFLCTDPPYGLDFAAWDASIPDWIETGAAIGEHRNVHYRANNNVEISTA